MFLFGLLKQYILWSCIIDSFSSNPTSPSSPWSRLDALFLLHHLFRMFLFSVPWVDFHFSCTSCFFPFSTAPSTVPIMHQVSATMRSITLSWPQPEQPNGIILDYEIRYYEKVSRICIPEISSTMGSRPATVSLNVFDGRELGWAINNLGSETPCCFPMCCEM